MTNSGVKLEGSEVTVSGNDGSGRCWLEKLTMDEDSKLVLKNVSQGISNYANVALEESLGTIRGFLPKDYSIANRKRNPQMLITEIPLWMQMVRLPRMWSFVIVR